MSSAFYQAGRIDKQAYVVSTAVMFGLCLLTVATRFYIRLQVQRQFSVDDGFLVLALCCLICALTILYSFTMDSMYLTQALTMSIFGGNHLSDVEIPPDVFQHVRDFHKWIIVVDMIAWCAIMAVKFSFLFLFRKLIDCIQPLIIYWWFVMAFNVAVLGYGVSVYYAPCPYWDGYKQYGCALPSGVATIMRFSIGQIVLDVLGDLFILYIPVKLIWKVQFKWAQKAGLACSLCLTVIMIFVTIARVSGIMINGVIDYVWITYFTIVAAEIGIILAAVTSFRTYFSSRHRRHDNNIGRSSNNRMNWSSRITHLSKRLLATYLWPSKSKGQPKSEQHGADDNGFYSKMNLSDFPRAHMTGIRTFIDGLENPTTTTCVTESQAMQDDDERDTWPFHIKVRNAISQV